MLSGASKIWDPRGQYLWSWSDETWSVTCWEDFAHLLWLRAAPPSAHALKTKTRHKHTVFHLKWTWKLPHVALLEQAATWGRQRTQDPLVCSCTVCQSLLDSLGFSGWGSGWWWCVAGGGPGVKRSASTPSSRWKGHCLPWASQAKFPLKSHICELRRTPLINVGITSSSSRRWQQHAGGRVSV